MREKNAPAFGTPARGPSELDAASPRLNLPRLQRHALGRSLVYDLRAERTIDLSTRITTFLPLDVLGHQPSRYCIAQFASPILALGKSDQPITPVAAEHLIEVLIGELGKIPAKRRQIRSLMRTEHGGILHQKSL
jgi:hypothetical protein